MFNRIISILLPVVLFATGCMPDNCTSVACYNEGLCVQGKCTCPFGYEGDFCQTRWNEKFTGNWNASDLPAGDTSRSYAINVIAGSGPDSFYILDLGEKVDSVLCTRKAFRVFSMHERILPDSSKMTGGEGVYDEQSGRVTGMYSFNQKDVITTVTFSWSK